MTHHEFTVSGVLYRSGGIDPVAQGHVARRLMPLADALAPTLKKLLQGGKPLLPSEQGLAGMVDRALPIIEFLSATTTETHDYLLNATLAKVERLGPSGRWERVWSDKRGLLVEGISGADVIEIAFHVLAADMAPFFLSLIERMPKAAMQAPIARQFHG